MKHKVFISHSSKDKTTGDEVCRFLEANGIPCWIAPRDVTPGKNYGAAIVDAIDECPVFVLILSSESNKSGQVVREVERAASSDSVIIPLRVEPVQPSRNLEFYVSSSHWLDAIEKPLAKHLGHLLEAIKNWEGSPETEQKQAPLATSMTSAPSGRGLNRQSMIAAAGIAGVVLCALIVFLAFHRSSERRMTSQPRSAPTPKSMASRNPIVASPIPTTQAMQPSVSPARHFPRSRPGAAINSPAASPDVAGASAPKLRPGAPIAPAAPAIKQVTASSEMPADISAGEQKNHGASMAFDDDETTAWVANNSGPGEWIQVDFKSPTIIRSVSIYGGYGGDSSRYEANNRVHEIRMVFRNGAFKLFSLTDKMEFQRFDLPHHPVVESLKFEIVSVYRGTKNDRTPISEIIFNRDTD